MSINYCPNIRTYAKQDVESVPEKSRKWHLPASHTKRRNQRVNKVGHEDSLDLHQDSSGQVSLISFNKQT